MRKLLFWLLTILALHGLILGGCSSDDDPEPQKPYRLFNEQDSAIACEIYKSYSGKLEGVGPELILDSIKTWPSMWVWDKEEKRYNLVGLEIFSFDEPESGAYGYIPECIGELKHLRSLSIIGKCYYGELPESVTKLNLEHLWIEFTQFTSLPDDIFTENLTYVSIIENRKLKKLPPSVTRLRYRPTYPEPIFYMPDNAFTGECPAITHAYVQLFDNNFTSLDWTGAGGVDWLVNGSVIHSGANLQGNRLQGEVPEDVLEKLLKDPIRFNNFHGQILQQQEGYGFTNIPSWAEVSEMKKEYIANNPDWKENLPKWGEELPER